MDNIKVLLEDIILARKFANATWDKTRSYGRNKEQVIDNIFVGKIGEIAYCKLFGLGSPDFDTNKDFDPGWDIIDTNGFKIDVKTYTNRTSKKLYFRSHRRTCDKYAIMFYDKKEFTASFIKHLDKVDVESKIITSLNSTYVILKEFGIIL